jgi:hypothetical protein
MALRRIAPVIASLLAAGSALLLSGCDYFGSDGASTVAAGDASGEVLEGSISDDMIPTDSLKSQPPALKVQPGTGADGEAVDSAAEGDPLAEDAAAADPAAPAAEPEAASE